VRILNEVLAQPGFSPALIGVGLVMYGAWTLAYLYIIISCFKQKSYGVPMITLCFNVIWEFCFSFNVMGSNLFWFFVWGNRLWFVFDVVIALQFFLYGRAQQVIPVLQRHFYLLAVATLLACSVGLYTFSFYFNDIQGAASSMTMNLVMSILYIFMLFNRPDCRGLSYPAAWLKMIGTAGGSVFLYVWWPAQFQNGRLIRHPEIPEPRTYSFMLFLYISIFVIDCTYIYLFAKRRRELASGTLPAVAQSSLAPGQPIPSL
jgi:hypothetical protein